MKGKKKYFTFSHYSLFIAFLKYIFSRVRKVTRFNFPVFAIAVFYLKYVTYFFSRLIKLKSQKMIWKIMCLMNKRHHYLE